MKHLKKVHGNPSNGKEHWEMHYSSDPQKDTTWRTGSEFDPRCGKYRMTTHVKVNEQDH